MRTHYYKVTCDKCGKEMPGLVDSLGEFVAVETEYGDFDLCTECNDECFGWAKALNEKREAQYPEDDDE